MDDTRRARIAGFDFAMVTHNTDVMWNTSPSRGHAARWTAPEILVEGMSSKKADVFSFAMVMIEVSRGQPIMR